MGVVIAAEETQAPVIIQMYSRLFNTGTGKYMAPELATSRIAEIHAVTDAHLVLHGGSGIPDDQIRAAVKAGIRKINFGTDVCCAFIEGYRKEDPYSAPLDVVMAKVSESVKAFALEKIRLLGADRRKRENKR